MGHKCLSKLRGVCSTECMFYCNMIAAVGGKSEFCSVKCMLRHAPPSPLPIRYLTPRKCKQIVLGPFEAVVES